MSKKHKKHKHQPVVSLVKNEQEEAQVDKSEVEAMSDQENQDKEKEVVAEASEESKDESKEESKEE